MNNQSSKYKELENKKNDTHLKWITREKYSTVFIQFKKIEKTEKDQLNDQASKSNEGQSKNGTKRKRNPKIKVPNLDPEKEKKSTQRP